MCFLSDFTIFLTTWLPHLTLKNLYYTVDLRKTPWTLICLAIWTLLTWKMSERACCVPQCGKTRADNTVLHSFPNPDVELERFLAWLQAVGSSVSSLDYQSVYKNRRVCHDHFETRYLTWTRRLSPGSIPTLHLSGETSAPATEVARVPMVDITNKYALSGNVETVGLRGETSARATEVERVMMEITNKNVNVQSENLVSHKSKGDTSNQARGNQPKSKQPRLPKKMQFLELTKTVRILQKQKDSYARRLKKALKLSENKTFLNSISKFTTLATLFTLMQFREIKKEKMGRRYKESEKIMSLSLYKRSPRAYRWLQKNFVLPSPVTLNRMIGKANFNAGINENLFSQLKIRVKKMKADEKLCVLLFDEMYIAPHFDYNMGRDTISGFVNDGKSRQKKIANHALVFMIRGIQKNYKQSVAYTLCSGSTSKQELVVLIKDIIRKLHSVGFHVLATVCDQGASNVSAINYLIDETKSRYLRNNKELRREIYEVDEKEIIPLFDPPHLIKGIRNNLIDKDLKCTIDGSNKIAKWEHIIKLHEEDPAYKGIRLVKKMTEHHINPDKFQKMKVKYATQVLSQRVAATMGFLAESNILPKECTETADVILFFDELFDSVNGSFDNSKKRSGKTLLCAVTPTSDHRAVWAKAKAVLSTMKYIIKNSEEQTKLVTIPTINNWLRTVKNIEYLIDKLFNNYCLKSVWMRHFNQDPLENFFGLIRSHGCRNTNPTPAGFESSFASILITNLSGQHSPGSNCEEDSCQAIVKSIKCLFKNPSVPSTTQLVDVPFESVYVDFEFKKNDPRINAQLQYVTGYLLKKAKQNVFKNCKKCKECLYDEHNISDFLKIREYSKTKRQLTYPANELVQLFSKKQDIITYVLKNYSLIPNLKIYLKTLIYTELDFNLFKCEKHKSETIDYMLQLSCIFFICNWCKDVNKILNGSRLDVDEDDNVKMMAFNYFKKKKHNKKK